MNNSPSLTASAAIEPADGTPEPGLILRIHPADEPAMQAHAGAASLELDTLITEKTAFNAGSVAKQITAYLCVRAARDGLLQLDRAVDSFLPRFRVPGVTVAELIQHHGGIRDAESLLSLAGFRDLDHYTADDLLQLAYRQHDRAVEPSRFLYSNTGYLLLAEILTHVHDAPLQEIAEQQVFTPLGMSSARFKSDPREVITGAASSYQPTATGWSTSNAPSPCPAQARCGAPSLIWTAGSATFGTNGRRRLATSSRWSNTSAIGPATTPHSRTELGCTPIHARAAPPSFTTATNRASPLPPFSPAPGSGSSACPTTPTSPPTTSPHRSWPTSPATLAPTPVSSCPVPFALSPRRGLWRRTTEAATRRCHMRRSVPTPAERYQARYASPAVGTPSTCGGVAPETFSQPPAPRRTRRTATR